MVARSPRALACGLVLLALCCLSVAAPAFASRPAPSDKCRILTLSGHGDNLAYTAGALKAIAEVAPTELSSYNIIAGISGGALLAHAVATSDKPAELATFLTNFVGSLRKSDVYREWPGTADVWTKRTGLLDNSPLQTTIQNKLMTRKLQPGRALMVGAVLMLSGQLEVFDETTAQLGTALLASTATAGLFAAVNRTNLGVHVGGDLKHPWMLEEPIRRCLDDGFEEDQIQVDMVLGDALSFVPSMDSRQTLQIVLRSMAVARTWRALSVMDIAMYAHPKIQMRYLVSTGQSSRSFSRPLHLDTLSGVTVSRADCRAAAPFLLTTRFLPPSLRTRCHLLPLYAAVVPFRGSGIDYDPLHMAEMFQQGQDDAKKVVKLQREMLSSTGDVSAFSRARWAEIREQLLQPPAIPGLD